MRPHLLSSLVALAALASFVPAPVFAHGGAPSSQVTAKPAPATKAWTMPRTPDGKPDLQGVYSNATSVPVARPAYLGAKEFYTDEADKAASAAAARGGRGGAAARPAAAPDPEGNGLAVHYDTSQ